MNLSLVFNLITASTVLFTGAWTFYHFVITRARHPKLEIDLELSTLGKSGSNYIVELSALISNKGLTRQHIHNFTFNVLTYSDDMPFYTNENLQYQLQFKPRLVDMYWVNPDHHQFVDGGITRRFTHVTVIPDHVRFIMIYSKFHNKYTTLQLQQKPNKQQVSLEPPDEILSHPKPAMSRSSDKHHRYHICRTFACH